MVGAGPSGLAAGCELGMRGIPSVLVEPRIKVAHTRPRAKTTSIRTMEHMRRWGVADALRAASPLSVDWSQRVTFCENLSGARILDFDDSFGLSAGLLPLAAERGQQVPQPVMEEVLRAHVSGLASTRLRIGEAVRELEKQGDVWSARVEDAQGAHYWIEADYVLGCDGSSGIVRDVIGASYVGRSDPRSNFNVVFHAPGLDTPLGPAVQYWVMLGDAPGVMGRLDLAGTWWAILPGVTPGTGNAHLRELLTSMVGRPFDYDVVATDPWTARMLIADKFQEDSAFLVGDSAHLNPPWGGHGYNSSVGDAVNICWKIAAVCQGWAPKAILDTYDGERRGVIEQTILLAEGNMAHLPGDLATDPQAIRRAKSSEFYSLDLVLGYTYAGSPIIQPGETEKPPIPVARDSYAPSTAPGSRLPHQWLADGSSLYDHLGQGFTLLGPDLENRAVNELIDRCQRDGLPLKTVRVPDDYPWRSEFLLVRPDQHVAWRSADPADLDLDYAVGVHREAVVTRDSSALASAPNLKSV